MSTTKKLRDAKANIEADKAKRALVISAAVQPFLKGQGADVQSAVLADLLSLWLAGHFADGREATKQLRKSLMRQHIKAVWALIDESEREILDKIETRGTA